MFCQALIITIAFLIFKHLLDGFYSQYFKIYLNNYVNGKKNSKKRRKIEKKFIF
uniref:Uncharacterized protein n=1 Tax=Meloidogyne enterolobii TaxID=390850 RepID=A0A6V7TWN6_MELEN|nr:unnamed protein product [Meloidogyne enterolobii]